MAQATARTRRPRAPQSPPDPPVAKGAELTVLQAIKAYRLEADRARRARLRQNRINWDAYMGIQDFSHKQAGQSREVLPKTSEAVEQVCAFAKRALVDFGDWFSLELADQSQGLTDDQARRLLKHKLDQGGGNSGRSDFATLVADALKLGLLGSLMVVKVHGRDVTRDVFTVERGRNFLTMDDGTVMPQITSELVRKPVTTFQLLIDLVPPEEYLPDPTGRGLYEIHEVERDLWEVVEMAEAGVYDPAVVGQIEQDYAQREETYLRAEHRGQDEAQPPSFRKRVVVTECWGTLLRPNGRVAERNIVTAMANQQWLIRAPEPNPFWHGQRPFVSTPLIRVPRSVWHKALMDHAVSLNFALNELYNLMLDGGIAAVWGVKTIRPEYLDDPRVISDGIPPGITLVLRDGAPANVKVVEQVQTGQVPQDALAMFQATDLEFQVATQVNAIKLGQQPAKQTTATAIVEASQQSATFFDGIIRDVEHEFMQPVLWKAWATEMQHLEEVAADQVVTAIGERGALTLAQMTPAQRFVAFAQGVQIKVSGLSAVLARVRDVQKWMALLGALGQNPMLMQAFWQKYSPQKLLARFFKGLNIDPESLEQDEQEKAQMPQQFEQLMQLMAQGRGGRGTPRVGPEAGGASALPVERMPASQAGMG